MNLAGALLEDFDDSNNNRERPTRSNNDNEDSCYNESETINEDDDMIYNGRTGIVEEVTRVVNENVGVSSYVFSKDFLPVRYDRQVQSDLPLRIIALTELALNVTMIVIFVQGGVASYTSTNFGIVHLSITCFFFIFAMFWLNYKVHMMLLSIYRLFVDLNVTKRNDKYYSGLEIPDFYVQSKEYPHVTIQIPVYKENLQNTIKPTLLNCCREADRYMDETSAFCNVVVCDDGYNLIPVNDRLERLEFYKEVGVGFTARPHPSKYPRHGRFKKAGNLNFSMNFSAAFGVTEDEDSELKTKRDELIALGACYGGDVSYGSYILLIDSDTRLPVIPMTENGCLKRLAKEMMFDGHEVLFIQCYTGPYMSVKSSSEKSVFHHTCSIYNSILLATAIRSMAPLVGHNAFLNMKALTECAHVDEGTGYYNFWAEDRISEDFDLMMRGCEHGYIGRYACHAGIFLEGVSFSYMTEYFKISKFACGAAELIYNPMSHWCRDGIISSDLIGFVKSKEVEWYNKMIILAYIFNFIALAAAHFGLLYNLFFCEWLYEILPPAFMATNLLWESIFIWTIFGGCLAYLFGCRLGFNKWLLAKQMTREACFLTCLYGSISIRFSIMSFTHLFGWNLSFGATCKDHDKVTLFDWISSTPMECTVYTFYAGLMVARILFLTAPDQVFFVLYYGCVPLMWTLFLFWAGPIFWDILPRKTKKMEQSSYIKDDKMFIDKYFTQLPNSPVVQKMKVGSNFKLPPSSLNNENRSQRSEYASTTAADDDLSHNNGKWSPRSLLTTTSKATNTTTVTSSLKNSNNMNTSRSNDSTAVVSTEYHRNNETLMKSMQEQMLKLEEKIAQLTSLDPNGSNENIHYHSREGSRRKGRRRGDHRGRKYSQSADGVRERGKKRGRRHQQRKRQGSAHSTSSAAPYTTDDQEYDVDGYGSYDSYDDDYSSSCSDDDSDDGDSSDDEDDDEDDDEEIDYEKYYIKNKGGKKKQAKHKVVVLSVKDKIKALESKLTNAATATAPSTTAVEDVATNMDDDDGDDDNNDENDTASNKRMKKDKKPNNKKKKSNSNNNKRRPNRRRRTFTPPRSPSPPRVSRPLLPLLLSHTSSTTAVAAVDIAVPSEIIVTAASNNNNNNNNYMDYTISLNDIGSGDTVYTSNEGESSSNDSSSYKLPPPRRMSSTANVLRVTAARNSNHFDKNNSNNHRSMTPLSTMTHTSSGSSGSRINNYSNNNNNNIINSNNSRNNNPRFKTPTTTVRGRLSTTAADNQQYEPSLPQPPPTFQDTVRNRLRSMSTIITSTPRRMSIIAGGFIDPTSTAAAMNHNNNGDGNNINDNNNITTSNRGGGKQLKDSNEIKWMDNPCSPITLGSNDDWNNNNNNNTSTNKSIVTSITMNSATQFGVYFKKESLSKTRRPSQLHNLKQQQQRQLQERRQLQQQQHDE